MDIADDPRFLSGVALLRAHDYYYDAAEAFEDLFFEAVRDEVPFARVFLQVAAGGHHLERGQRQAAIDRLGEALIALKQVTNDRGYDLARLRRDVQTLIAGVRSGEPFTWPEVFRRVLSPEY